MNSKQLRAISYCFFVMMLAILTLNVTACSNTKTTTTFTDTPVLTSIAVTPNPPPSLTQRNTQQFKAVGTYSDGSTSDITSQVTWTSDNTAAATINNSGLATGVAAGIANITATLNGITSPVQALVVVSYY
jgi:trimeric autotransporter adhesin